MQKYRCQVCNYIYDPSNGDPDNGIKPGTAFGDIPDTWVCPVCGVTKDNFVKEDWILTFDREYDIIYILRDGYGKSPKRL